MTTVILFYQVPKKTMGEDTKTLTKGSYVAVRADFASAAIISNSGHRNHIEPGLSQDDIRLRDEQKRLAEEAEKKKRETIARAGTRGRYQTQSNTYAWGNCTWFVKNALPQVPNGWGDAKYWPVNSKEPVAGGVVVTRESWYGHVAVVEKVEGDKITLVEMNYGYANFNRVTRRTISRYAPFIKGFIRI